MRVNVVTDEFRFSHGKAPRGRGSWAFSPFEDIDCCDKRIIWVNDTFGAARAQAVAIAKTRGLDTLFVLS